ncbi:MAG: hypothetical protein WCV81_03170 [Microgenomates group bacterium]|jgi:hypothetical protein
MDTSIKPQGSVEFFHDEHDKKASHLYEEFERKRTPELVLEAAQEFEISSNPDGKKIGILLRGQYFREKALKEENNEKARRLLLKAISNFKKIVKPDDIILKKLELEFLKRKLMGSKEIKSKPDPKLFFRRATLFKETGQIKGYHQDMSLYHMFSVLDKLTKVEDQEIIDHAEQMLEHSKQGEEPELILKTESLYHGIKAQHVFSPKERAEELKKAIEAIDQTSDKYGKDTTETEYLMTKAMMTSNINKRNQLLNVVAKRYKKQGQREREVFVEKLLSPVPFKAAGIIYLADQSLEKLRKLEQRLNVYKGTQQGPFAIFYHISYMMERIKDVRIILLRMALTRKSITDLNIRENALRPKKIAPGKPCPEKLQILYRRSTELRDQMKQDMESLFIYGNLLLDQWSYLIGRIAGYEVSKNPRMQSEFYFQDFLKLFSDQTTKEDLKKFWGTHKKEVVDHELEINFVGLLNLIQSKKYKGELLSFWEEHKKDIIWLNFHLRFYRNVFIEHLRKPWQRGNTMGTYGDDFSFHIPAAVGFVKPEEVKKILEEIYPLSPQRLRDMPDDYWEKKNLHRVLEVTLYFIDEIEDQVDREKVWNAWHKLGGSTPSYDVIGSRLFSYIHSSIDTMAEFIDKYPKLLKFGKF